MMNMIEKEMADEVTIFCRKDASPIMLMPCTQIRLTYCLYWCAVVNQMNKSPALATASAVLKVTSIRSFALAKR